MIIKNWWQNNFDQYDDSTYLGVIRIGLVTTAWFCWTPMLFVFENSSPEILVAGATFQISGILAILGYRTNFFLRIFSITAMFLFFYIGQLNQGYIPHDRGFFAPYNTQFMVFSLAILATTSSGKSLSLDNYIAKKNNQKIEELSPKWVRTLFAILLFTLFLYAFLSKVSVDFFTGHRLEQILMFVYFGSDRPDAPWFKALAMFMTYGALANQAFVIITILFKKWHFYCYLAICFWAATIFFVFPQNNFAYCLVFTALALIPEKANKVLRRIRET